MMITHPVLHVYCDASPFAMGFWYPSVTLKCQAPAHHIFSQQEGSIICLESLCVCAAILDAAPRLSPDQRLAVFRDNINPLVVRTLKGSMRRFSNPVQQKSPLTRDDLRHVYNHLLRQLTHDNHLFLTMLLVGFFGLLRLGELMQPDTSSLRSSAKTSWRHDVCLDSTSFSFIIPQSKTDAMFEGDQVVIQKSTTAPDPFAVFRKHLGSRDSLFPLFPLLWLRSDGSVPSWSWLLSRLHVFFPRSIGGHSMHAGVATSLAAAGVPPSQI